MFQKEQSPGIEEEPARRSGISLPDSAKEKPQEEEVIAVGKGKVSDDGKKIPLDVKAGDPVLRQGLR